MTESETKQREKTRDIIKTQRAKIIDILARLKKSNIETDTITGPFIPVLSYSISRGNRMVGVDMDEDNRRKALRKRPIRKATYPLSLNPSAVKARSISPQNR